MQNVVGRRVTEVIPGITATDPELFETYGRVSRSGQPERFEYWQILEPRVLNVSTGLAGLESLIQRLLGEDIDLVVVPTPDVGFVKVDAGQLEQVTTNLAVNARDETRRNLS